MFDFKLTAEDRITRSKIHLQDSHPFWAYLIMKLKIIEDKDNKLPEYAGMGVNTQGEMLWKRSFVNGLSEEELKFVLAHEVGHLVFGHLFRLGNRNIVFFNIAADMIINDILRENGFTPPKDCIIPDYNHTMKIFGKTIENVNEKTAEELYEVVYQKEIFKEVGLKEIGFDHHEYGELSDKEKEALEEKWKENLIEAAVHSKQRGKLPANIERLVGHLLNPKFNWRQMLRKYIVSMLPYDFSFSRPNRKIPNFILPGVIKETVDIVVHIDTSGSIGKHELNLFLSEIIGIANSHKNLNMTLIECDMQINQVIQVNSKNSSKIKNFKMKGGGGTSHKTVWEYIKKNKRNCKLFISLTDLYSDIELKDKPSAEVLWLVPKSGDTKVPFGKILRLE